MLIQSDHARILGLEAHLEASALRFTRKELLEHGANRHFGSCHRHEIGDGAHSVLSTRQLSRQVYRLDMD